MITPETVIITFTIVSLIVIVGNYMYQENKLHKGKTPFRKGI